MDDKVTAVVALPCAAADVEKLTRVRLVPDGHVPSLNGEFTLDAKGAEQVIAQFRRHGVELPIDFNHESLSNAHAPAAGWVVNLSYEPGQGLFGDVRWNSDARDLIRSRKFQYLSPVLILDKPARRVVGLMSVGLTNTPAIPKMSRLAASHRQANATDPTDPDDPQQMNPEQILGEIKALMGLQVEGGVPEILLAIRDKARQLFGEEEIAENVRSRLGLSPQATKHEILLALETRESTEVAEYREREATRLAQEHVNRYVQQNKLNPRNTVAMQAALDLAKTHPDRLDAMMNDVAPYVMPGRTTPPSPAQTQRYKVIRNAALEYKDAPELQKTCNRDAYVANALRENGLEPLAEGELNWV